MTDELLGELSPRACPLCGSTDDSDVFAVERLHTPSLGRSAFASRKRPEHMRLRLVRCPQCDLVYATPVPAPEALARAYEAAAFDSAIEARFAARTYAEALGPLLGTLPDRDGALDIGTGDGAFLAELLDAGFTGVGGVEPSTEPIAAADARIAELIEHGVFTPDMRPAGSLSLVTCFQTIEHVPDPAVLVRDVARLLKPGGVLALVCHDRRAPVNRLLGLRSPIVDVEHQQLFSPASVRRLLRQAGLVDVAHRAIRNRYPLRYWVRLLPLPRRAGELSERLLERTGIGDPALTLPVGNLLAWGRRSADPARPAAHAAAV
ncbi:MAG: class I SAM-dependent methyltransferase [Chloroflexota bacterium]|nr:class I SAM-dependent methyltransferase [Chloroflexota bacterium]